MDKVTCPYCDKECEVDHDDGANYEEDNLTEQQCEHCEKMFFISTSVLYHHTGSIAPCLNGEEHDWQDMNGHPKEYFEGKKRCSYCDEEKDFYTKEQREECQKRLMKSFETK